MPRNYGDFPRKPLKPKDKYTKWEYFNDVCLDPGVFKGIYFRKNLTRKNKYQVKLGTYKLKHYGK